VRGWRSMTTAVDGLADMAGSFGLAVCKARDFVDELWYRSVTVAI
jgi:hypothetical protein